MAEARVPYTAGHQIHVGTLSASIASQLGLDERLVALIRQCGELHDVGKISVLAEVSTRPGKLNSIEFEIVKTHTTVGYEILAKASLPWPIAEVALRRHERMDESGYPPGLRGDDIMLPARIVAVADVVEAMAQHRPYRPARGLPKELEEITQGDGMTFGAEVVRACRTVFDGGFEFSSPPAAFPR